MPVSIPCQVDAPPTRRRSVSSDHFQGNQNNAEDKRKSCGGAGGGEEEGGAHTERITERNYTTMCVLYIYKAATWKHETFHEWLAAIEVQFNEPTQGPFQTRIKTGFTIRVWIEIKLGKQSETFF